MSVNGAWLGRKAAAAYLGIGVSTLDRLIADGHLHPYRPHGIKRGKWLHTTALDAWMTAEAPVEVVEPWTPDRMAANANAQTRKEWEAAKEGRSLRGPDGRWLKAEGPPP